MAILGSSSVVAAHMQRLPLSRIGCFGRNSLFSDPDHRELRAKVKDFITLLAMSPDDIGVGGEHFLTAVSLEKGTRKAGYKRYIPGVRVGHRGGSVSKWLG